ncbi:conserved Plasmodium protein, unknown function [Plasmodium malariae]|uniref:Uncharacterized protein n=2 Tax=Plasmodium malariae TaxID=5858 RepID=A0A1D3TEC1_PLAMA|nr:conserved Plasmodium protein, unknown function [Plasmodium malariae]SCP03289.1 conserved Plasmodium protein, unknown function [Plasmodium malariae]
MEKKTKNEEVNNLIKLIMSELESSKAYIERKGINGIYDANEERIPSKSYSEILSCINEKLHFYQNLSGYVDKRNECDEKEGNENKRDDNDRDDDDRDDDDRDDDDRDDDDDKTSKREGENFFGEYEKKKCDLYKLKKKEIAGYTTEGHAIIINNEKFSKLFMNYDVSKELKRSNKDDNYNSLNYYDKHKELMNGKEEKTGNIENGYLSEISCSSSSVISLNSFIKSQKTQRINKNRETYVKHKYHDNAFVSHKLYSCSDCSSSTFSWYDKQYDDLFYYTNLLKEDKHLKKGKSKFRYLKKKKKKKREMGKGMEVEVENETEKETANEAEKETANEAEKETTNEAEKETSNEAEKETANEAEKETTNEAEKETTNEAEKETSNEADENLQTCAERIQSPFYSYIYFKYKEKGKEELYPVFINTVNGKKKICNLKKINKYSQKHHPNEQGDINKYELDSSLFSYKNCKHLSSVKSECIRSKHFKNNQTVDALKRRHFDLDEVTYSIDKIIHQLENLSNPDNRNKKTINYSDHFANFVKKNKEYLKRENNFSFKKLCDTEKIKLKVKIIGTDGKIIKNKSLDNVLINKNKTFGDLANRLGHSFNIPKDKIEKIKMFFDGELCDKNLTFDNEELGLEDGYQIDVKFPLTDEITCNEKDSSCSDDSYVLFLPDSYVID